MQYSDKQATKMERQVPEKAAKAFKAAYKQTLNAGCKVLIVSDGKLIEVSPDLQRKVLRNVATGPVVPKGTKRKLK